MKLKDIIEWSKNLPEEFLDYSVVNGEWGEMGEGTELTYRVDKPIVTLDVDEDNKEILFLHQKQEDVDKIRNEDE